MLIDFFRKDAETRKLVSAKTNKVKRIVGFYLTVVYILLLFIGTHTGFTKDSLTILGETYATEDIFRWYLLGISVLGIASVIVGNGLNYYFIIAAQVIEIFALIISYIYMPSNFKILCFCFTITGYLTMTALKFYIYKTKYNESRIDRAAYYDTLTKCINRGGLLKLMENEEIKDQPFFLVFLDLDNFKAVNDTLGHDAGDELLKFVAKQWSDIKIYDKCTLARLGGDEFALVIESDDKTIAKKVIREMFNSIKTGCDLASYVTTSAGIASFPNDTREIPKLLSYADTAMYKAKSAGKNRYMFFDAEMYKEIVERYNIEKNIKDALQTDKFYLLYQPQFLAEDQKLVGYEALVRMSLPSGDVPPSKFIKIAEQSGLIFDLDIWVLKHTLTEALPLLKEDKNLIFSVNLSGKHLCDQSLIPDVLEVLARTKFPAENLEFEITESSYIKHIDEAVSNISKLRDIGCRIALDDFGTGYSSLSFLTKLKTDIVKIDQSFISGIDTDPDRAKFVMIIIQLAHLLGCKVIAEGVESEGQIQKLKELGADILQGFYWGKPSRIGNIFTKY